MHTMRTVSLFLIKLKQRIRFNQYRIKAFILSFLKNSLYLRAFEAFIQYINKIITNIEVLTRRKESRLKEKESANARRLDKETQGRESHWRKGRK